MAVYEYKLPQGEIPLVIVDHTAINRDILKKEFSRSKWCIVLTHDDVKHGTDVFALRFLHMQQRTVFVGGEELLKDIKIKKDNLREEFEYVLRSLLIDLREMILLPNIHKTTHSMLELALDRILVAAEELGEKHHKGHEWELKDAIDACHAHKVDHEFLVMLYKKIEHLTKIVDEE